MVSSRATATDWDLFETENDSETEDTDARDEERLIDHSAPVNVDAMNTEYINKSNQVWDTMESERWIYNLDGEEGIVPTVKKSKPKTYLEINEDES